MDKIKLRFTDDIIKKAKEQTPDRIKEKDPSEIGFSEFWKILKNTKQTKFSDLIKERLYG